MRLLEFKLRALTSSITSVAAVFPMRSTGRNIRHEKTRHRTRTGKRDDLAAIQRGRHRPSFSEEKEYRIPVSVILRAS